MWEKIVLNLLSNAFKFTFEGEIGVSVRMVGAAAELEVRDTGIGIPESELSHVFERFHRVEGAKGRTHEGTGIGLALVSELVKLHGGTVSVASVPGKGTTFRVTVPAGTAHLPGDHIQAAQSIPPKPTSTSQFLGEALRWLPDEDSRRHVAEPLSEMLIASGEIADAKRPRVFVADDNADMRDYIQRLLGERYETQAFPDGQQALAAVRQHAPDLILTDVMMPWLDGFGLLRELRSDPVAAAVPVIMLSARAGEEARSEGLEAGADDYLVKPFSARELVAHGQRR